MVKQLGATRDEVKDAILLTITVCGLQGVANCLPLALKTFDETPG
jgi:alkylhydroperoxidase/carboxymuconolactone decarboxylase family protein YurZ